MKMYLHLSQPLYLLTLLIFISINLPKFTRSEDRKSLNCTQPFKCGSIENLNLKYPFWGGNRAPDCGLPGFELQCLDKNVPIMNISSIEYKFLASDPEAQKVTVARADYWDTICPSALTNTTINGTLFNYVLNQSYLSFFYGCPDPFLANLGILGKSTCNINGSPTEVSFRTGMYPPHLGCLGVVNVPILEPPPSLGLASVLDTLRKGFELQWKVGDFHCQKCMESGGECGYNWTQKTSTCFCSDQPYASECQARPGIVSMNHFHYKYIYSFGGVSQKSDVYSYGMLVLEMVGGRKKPDGEVESSSDQYFPQWIYKQLESGEELDHHENLSDEEKQLQKKMVLVSLWCVQTHPSSRPTMTRVVEMLEGTFDSLQIPPVPSLASPSRSQQNSSTIVTVSIS